MITLTSIATEVFDAVSAELGGVIKSLEFSRSVKGAYDTETGAYTTTTLEYTGRGLAETDTARRAATDFPAYVLTGKETVWFVAELAEVPKVSDVFSLGSSELKIVAVRDILETGELYRLLVL